MKVHRVDLQIRDISEQKEEETVMAPPLRRPSVQRAHGNDSM
jgi:hypothetical protein